MGGMGLHAWVGDSGQGRGVRIGLLALEER